MLKESREAAFFALLLDSNQLLLSSLSDLENVVLGGCLASDCEQTNGVGLAHGAQLGVAPPDVPLPVWVVGDIARREGDWVIVGKRGNRARGGETELSVQRDTRGTFRVNSEKATNALPDASGLDCVFLEREED